MKWTTEGRAHRNGADDALRMKRLAVIGQKKHEIMKIVAHVAVLVRILELRVEEEGGFAERTDFFR